MKGHEQRPSQEGKNSNPNYRKKPLIPRGKGKEEKHRHFASPAGSEGKNNNEGRFEHRGGIVSPAHNLRRVFRLELLAKRS